VPSAEELAKLITADPAAAKLAQEAQAVMQTALEATERPVQAPKLTPKSLGGLTVQRMADKRLDFLNGLIYGDPGVGKTTFLATASLVPAMSPMLLLDIEGGDLSLTGFPNLEVVRVASYKKMQPIYDELYREQNGKNPPYRTIGLDNLTELRYFSMGDIMLDAKATAKNPDNIDLDVPGMREWGKNSNQIRAVVRGFRDLPCHTFFTAHAKEVENKATEVVKIKPAIPGQLAEELSGFVDLVLYYYVKLVAVKGVTEHKRLMLTTKTANINAKDRSGKLPPVMETPTMEDLIRLILPEQLKEETK
jgi:hypothetical protein